MSNEITPPPIPPEVPFILTEEGQKKAFAAISNGVKYAKAAIITIVVILISIVGLISWVVIHFISKAW